MGNVKAQLASFVLRLSTALPDRWHYMLFRAWMKDFAQKQAPVEALHLLWKIQSDVDKRIDAIAMSYDHGIHVKHRLTGYHDFFVKHIDPGSQVLDVGCGHGAVAFDIAQKVKGAFVYGIDLNPESIELAERRCSLQDLRFVCGDALTELPDESFDVVVLSNVLEHIEKRVDFLRSLQNKYRPKKFLIRVPVFERDWQVPFKEELGVDYHLDPTHYIEYRQEEFFDEIAGAGLKIAHIQVKWGEIWAEVSTAGEHENNYC